MFPNEANMALKINVKNEKITIAEEFQSECDRKVEDFALLYANYIMSKTVGDTIYVHTGKSNRLIEYNTKTGYRREAPIVLTEAAAAATVEMRSHVFMKDVGICKTVNDCNFYEYEVSTLRDFIAYVNRGDGSKDFTRLSDKQIELFKRSTKHLDGTSGAAIFAYCKQRVLGGIRTEVLT
jgi:hypothetical protein